jgi:hypothetical protein
MAFLCLTVNLLTFSYLGQAQSAYYTKTARTVTTSLASDGFYEFLPPGYDPNGTTTYPLMVFLHGSGEVGNGKSDISTVLRNGPPKLINAGTFPTSFTVGGKTFSFIVIAPQFKYWPGSYDADGMVQYAIQHYKVNTNRIYITGLSMGGGVTWDYAITPDLTPKVAAILTVAGAEGLDATTAQTIASANLPVYATHNLNDPTVQSYYTVDNVNFINNSHPPPTPRAVATIFNANVHDAWTKTYDPAFLNPDIGNLNAYQWMLQYSKGTAAVPLPVTLSAYSATLSADQSQVAVNWTTAFEQNNRYFVLQRSGDGQQYINLDTIAATNEASGHSYSYTDLSPLPGNDFYRLTQVDLDGKTTVFRVLSVTISAETRSTLRLGPNPADNTLYLKFAHAGQGTLAVSVSDVQGKILKSWKFQKQETVWDQAIDLSNLPAGNYFIRLQTGKYNTVQQFVKK